MADLSTLGIPAPEEVSSDAKLWALLAYLFPLFGILILVMDDKKNDPFMRFHAVQSLALAIIITVTCVGFGIGWIYAIYLALVAYKGETPEIPFITNFCQEKGWFNVG